MKTEDDDLCEICKKPVVDGEARHGRTGNHYDCQYPDGYKSDKELFGAMDLAINRAQSALNVLRQRIALEPRKPVKATPTLPSIVWDDPTTYDDDL